MFVHQANKFKQLPAAAALLPRLPAWRLIQIVEISWRLRTIINIIQMLLHLVVALNYPEVPITILIIAQVLSSYHESRNTIPTLNLEKISWNKMMSLL